MNIIKSEMGFKCDVCGKQYTKKFYYDKHLKDKHPKEYPAGDGDGECGYAIFEDALSALLVPISVSTCRACNFTWLIYPVGSTVTAPPGGGIPAVTTDNRKEDRVDDADPDVIDDITDEIRAAQILDWGDWSGTDDDEEIESYCQLIMDPWREEEAEEKLREQMAGLAEVDLAKSKPQQKAPMAVVKCGDCPSTFQTLDGYISHRVGHGMQGWWES